MSKIVKQISAGIFLMLLKAVGYSVKKISQFPERENLETIAIYSTTALGDFLLNTPAIAAIKAHWPKAKLLLVINKRNQLLVEGSPLFDEVLYWNGRVNGILSLAKKLRNHRVDATFILHSRTPYDIIAASLSWSRYILKDVYFNDYQGCKHFVLEDYLSALYDNRQNGNIHLIRQKTQMLASVGIAIPSESMFIPAPFTPALVNPLLIGIHAGASVADKCWPEEYFSQLIRHLISNHQDLIIELIGAPGEKKLNQRIIDRLPEPGSRVRNVAGTTNLIQLAAKIAGFRVLIVGDTGPLHIAIAVKTPTIGLFSSQSAIDGSAPLQDRDIHQVICPSKEAPDLRGIGVAEVYAAIERSLW